MISDLQNFHNKRIVKQFRERNMAENTVVNEIIATKVVE